MSNKEQITSLTPEQEAQIAVYRDRWIAIGLNTEPCNVEKTKAAIARAYEQQDLDAPLYYLGPVNSPYEAAIAEQVIQECVKNKTVFPDENTEEALNKFVIDEVEKRKHNNVEYSTSSQIFGCADYWLSYYEYFKNVLKLDGLEKIEPLVEIAENCGWWIPLQQIAIIQHRPLEIHREEVTVNDEVRYVAHNPDGAAILFRGDCEYSNLYMVHGVRVTKKIIDRNYTWQDIDNESNAEVRRVMIELYGQQKYLLDSNAKIVNEDEFGVLYSKEFDNDDPIMMVKVVNSTPEPDGTYKDYFLEVDPSSYGGLTTARAAIASTWRYEDGTMVYESPEEYILAQES